MTFPEIKTKMFWSTNAGQEPGNKTKVFSNFQHRNVSKFEHFCDQMQIVCFYDEND